MKKQYFIKKPSDFLIPIKDILDWCEESSKTNLVIALKGDLGAGKTTFTQELGKSLGISNVITSPTFTIMKQYEISHPNFDWLVHIDAYRIESEKEVQAINIKNFIEKPRAIVCIEWPEQIPSTVPKEAVFVSLFIKEEVRDMRVDYN